MTRELKIDLDWIPVMHIASKWEKISDNHYLLYNDVYQTKMFVSYSAIAIICQINSTNSIREITDKLTNGQANNADYERVIYFIQDQLYINGILETNSSSIKKRKSHFHFERIIIPGNFLQKICQPFLFLFKKQIVICIFLACVVGTTWIILKERLWAHYSSTDSNAIIFLIGLIILLLFHELGHCAALQYFGKKSKGIGFGFYIFTPVLFADVNSSWTLSPKKRMAVDLGGFYFQFIITTIYLIFYKITGEISLLNITYLSFFLFLFNMNPLINTDMYWFLSDALNRVNLNNEARNELSAFLKKSRNNINLFLLLFGIMKIIFVSVIFILISYFLANTAYLLLTYNYKISFNSVCRGIILVVGFVFFIKELVIILKRRR